MATSPPLSKWHQVHKVSKTGSLQRLSVTQVSRELPLKWGTSQIIPESPTSPDIDHCGWSHSSKAVLRYLFNSKKLKKQCSGSRVLGCGNGDQALWSKWAPVCFRARQGFRSSLILWTCGSWMQLQQCTAQLSIRTTRSRDRAFLVTWELEPKDKVSAFTGVGAHSPESTLFGAGHIINTISRVSF